jgi:hypothetical protein
MKIPVASGVLTAIASILVLIAAVLTINDALITYGGYGYGFIQGTNIFFWIAGVFEIIAFAAGLTGAICQIKSRYFLGAVFANILLLASSGFLIAETLFRIGKMVLTFGELLFFALPVLLLAAIGVTLVGMSHKEFKD